MGRAPPGRPVEPGLPGSGCPGRGRPCGPAIAPDVHAWSGPWSPVPVERQRRTRPGAVPEERDSPSQDRKQRSVPVSWGPQSLSWPPSGSLPIHHQHWWRVPSAPHVYELVTSGVSPRPTPTAVPWEAGRIWSGEARLIPSYFHLTEEKTKKKKPSGFASAVSLRGEGLAIVGGLVEPTGSHQLRPAPTPLSSSSSSLG